MTVNKIYFPYPVRHGGLFKYRHEVVNHYKNDTSKNANEPFVFRDTLPDAAKIHELFQLIAKDNFSKEYLGSLLTDEDKWKFTGSVSDIDNIYEGLAEMLRENLQNVYFMTNTGGHHADNSRYELFCPINHLFFMVELLNYHANFPHIKWVDMDAHFGNGDKKMWDDYKHKMSNEENNVSGYSFHNDAGVLEVEGYTARNYPKDISNEDFLALINDTVKLSGNDRYLILFFGTDIFRGDYGDNSALTTELIPHVFEYFSQLTLQNNSKLTGTP